MSLISQVGRRHWRTRLLIGSIYVALVAGSATMIYPFWLMLASSLTSNADVKNYALVPRYLYDRAERFRKYLVDKAHPAELGRQYDRADWLTIADVRFNTLVGRIRLAELESDCLGQFDRGVVTPALRAALAQHALEVTAPVRMQRQGTGRRGARSTECR